MNGKCITGAPLLTEKAKSVVEEAAVKGHCNVKLIRKKESDFRQGINNKICRGSDGSCVLGGTEGRNGVCLEKAGLFLFQGRKADW